MPTTNKPLNLSDATRQKLTITVVPVLWEERIVAAEAEDRRMESVLERAHHFHEWVAEYCFLERPERFAGTKRELGQLLARSGNFRLGKRWLSVSLGTSPIKAQQLLNQYHSIFGRVKDWAKKVERPEELVLNKIAKVIEQATIRCVKSLPAECCHDGGLNFSAFGYTDEIQLSKFFKHFFEQELEINCRIVKLPINVEFSKGEMI